MQENKSALESGDLAELVVKGMQERKAKDIVVMDMTHVNNAVANYFVVCSGTSDTQVDAISDAVAEEVYKHAKQDPWHKEGKQNREWILLDYVDVVVHIFKGDKRSFYGLEELWGDAKTTIIES
ncbi:ribosome silencing factor [Roseivirga sp. BDSF3-8]|uniref:ribosome silencing factor n=1 Tax=Roseivirga sp. BDSF3-8 TaxID=3241598 RepID=UPI00353223A8